MGSKAANILPLVTLGAFAIPGIGPAIGSALGLGGSAAAGAAGGLKLGTAGLLAGLADIARSAHQDAGFALEDAGQRLDLAQQQRDTERELERELARQNNLLAARGIEPGSGSARQAAKASAKARRRALLDLSAASSLDSEKLKLRRGSARRRRIERLPGLLDLRLPEFELLR